ncbi:MULTISPECIES: DUF5134 domain-containing protein [unclassified Streptomyces]|uniref:DUF5134 domain-containing protein n=1 Tax=unclassified Streptomyces TaxID=2593676 RepID=UPI001F039649|nr:MULTISPECIES: DUF5134 domain-containing protein [unclassified Streptomyces]MCH0566653.1 DUF5134 domain-containing protein [Streptomyces sp. MUM 2J]MCH0573361.1 DUF5134 domain-containing protein [Streptomyces sp. MUM 136J]
MGEPPLVGWLLTALGTATGVLCAVRSGARAAADRYARRTARAEAAMGMGMALMAAPGLAPRTGVWGPLALGVLFAGLAVRASLFARGEAHRLHHTVDAAAMTYMAALMAPPIGGGGMAGMDGMDGMRHGGHASMGLPLVDLALLAYYTLYVLRVGARLVPAPAAACTTPGPGRGGADDTSPRAWQGPAVGLACRLSLAMGMLAMVLAM